MTAENPTITAYVEANANWMSAASAAAISSLPDSAWPAVLAGLDELNAGATDPGIDCSVSVTHETLADFDAARSSNWAERGARRAVDCAGMPGVMFERFQLRRGDARRSQVVIDLGCRRVSLY